MNLAFRHLQSPLSKISRHQNYSLSHCPVSGEDLTFLPAMVYHLEEYGLPRIISKKIQLAGNLNFEEDEIELHGLIERFREIGVSNLVKQTPTLDTFDKYILDYFYDGIKINGT